MRRDPYHGIYHISAALYRRLNENRLNVVELHDPRDLGVIGVEPDDQVFYSNITVLRKTPWRGDNVPASLAMLVLVAGDATEIRLVRQDDRFVVDSNDGDFFMLIPSADVGRQMPLISSTSFRSEDIAGIYGDQHVQDEFTVLAVAVKALCQGDKCLYQ